jgi:sortase A
MSRAFDAGAPEEPAAGEVTKRVPALRWLARVCFVSAAVIAGYVLWIAWGTGLVTAQEQSDLRAELGPLLASPKPPPTLDEPARLPGGAYARILIPRMDLDMIVVEGTDTASLTKGPGHYPQSNDPWQDRGRVAIAGHRTTYQAPFWSLDKLQKGDSVTLETEFGTFDYEVTRSEVVPPTATQVADPTERPTLVLTTCNPRFSAAERLVVFADRV